MKNRILFLCLIFVLVFVKVQGQNVEWPKFKNYQPFQHYVYAQFMNDTGLSNWGCTKFLTTVKFIVNEDGFVSKVQVSEGTPLPIINKLKSIVRSTHGNWEPMNINGKAVPSRPMILQIYFSLLAGCDSDNELEDKRSKSFKRMMEYDQDTARDKHFAFENVMLFPPILIPTHIVEFDDLKKTKKKQE